MTFKNLEKQLQKEALRRKPTLDESEEFLYKKFLDDETEEDITDMDDDYKELDFDE